MARYGTGVRGAARWSLRDGTLDGAGRTSRSYYTSIPFVWWTGYVTGVYPGGVLTPALPDHCNIRPV